MKQKETIKVYTYTRVSTAMQVEKYSLSAQTDRIKAFCKYNEYQIVNSYSDEGKSGSDIAGRDEFEKMLFDIKRHKDDVKYVVVFKLSRFARNTRDALNTLNEMRDNGVELISVEDNINTSTSMGKMMMTLLSAFAEMELENIHIQTMAGRKRKASEGRWVAGFAPFGYELKDGQLEILENEAKIVRKIFDLYNTTDLSVRGVADRLNSEGIKKPLRLNSRRETFYPNYISDIIRHEVYKGYIVYGKRTTKKSDTGKIYAVKQRDESAIIVQKGLHTGLVSEEDWQAANDKLAKEREKRAPKASQAHIYVLSGLIVCPACGKNMYGIPSKKKKSDGTYYPTSYAYACRHKYNDIKNKCELSKQYNCKEIDEEFGRLLGEFFATGVIADAFYKSCNEKTNIDSLNETYDKLVTQLDKLTIRQKKLENEMDSLDLDSATYDKQYESLNNRLKKVFEEQTNQEKRIAETKDLINSAIDNRKSFDYAYNFLVKLGEYFNYIPPVQQKRIANMFVNKVEIFPEKRAYGYIKSISLKIPLFENDELKNKIDVWDINPSLDNEGNWKSESDDSMIDDEGYFRKYASQLDEQDEYERINGEDTNALKSKEEAEREREYYIERFSHLNADTFETVVSLIKK